MITIDLKMLSEIKCHNIFLLHVKVLEKKHSETGVMLFV